MADELKPFVCTYRYQGRRLGLTIEARSYDEVSAHLRAIGMTGVVNGELIREIDAGPFGEGFGRALVAARSFMRERDT